MLVAKAECCMKRMAATFTSVSLFSFEFFCSVFSPGCSFPAVAQKPSSTHFIEPAHYQSSDVRRLNQLEPPDQTDSRTPLVSETDNAIKSKLRDPQKQPMKEHHDFRKTAHTEAESVQPSVPSPLSQSSTSDSKPSKACTNTNTIKIQVDTKIDTCLRVPKVVSDMDKKISSFKKDSEVGVSSPTNFVPSGPSKDQQLQEEEIILLARIRQMSRDTSPASSSRSMKRLVPAPGDIDRDVTETKSCADAPADVTDQCRLRPDALQEIKLNDTEEPLEQDKV